MHPASRRGQGLPLNTIIISIIVVVVLVVIILIFTGNVSRTNDTLQSCVGQGGSCTIGDSSDCAAADGREIDATCTGTNENNVCCVVL